MKPKSILIFGAGKIGRSFIGQLFSRGGYEVIFIDKDEKIINALNSQKKYPVIIKGDKEETIWIENVSGISLSNKKEVIEKLKTIDLVAVSVGSYGFQEVAGIIASGLMERDKNGNYAPVDVILAENLRNAGEILYRYLTSLLPKDFKLSDRIGLIETSIGKMVPIMPPEIASKNPLLIYAEEYNTLIVDAKGFRNEIPSINGLSAKENMEAWVDRKLFIHNLGHASTAYLGNYYFPKKIFIWEVLEIEDISKKVFDTMTEAATVLLKIYPEEFTKEQLTDHINDLIRRFKNKSLGDTIFRVGCDLKRKLSYNDRLVAPLRLAYKNNLPYKNILFSLVCGCSFSAVDASGKELDEDFLINEEYKKYGISEILKKYCNLKRNEYPEIFTEAEKLKL